MGVLGDQLIQTIHQIDLLRLEAADLAARFAETDEYDEEGSVTPGEWIKHECKLRSSTAYDYIRVGEQMPELMDSVAAVREGRIGFDHLIHEARTREALDGVFDEATMLAQAEEVSVGKFFHVCEQARHAAKPKQVAEEQAEQAERSKLEFFHHEDGMCSLRGLFDGFSGAVIRNALEPLAGKAGKEDERPKAKRMADALVELAQGQQPAQLMVTVSAETLLGRPGTPGGELQYSPPLPLPTLERLRCDCVLHRVVMTDKSVVIDAGRGRRIVTDPQRRALQVRDQECRWRGCNRPATRCTPHHVKPWSEGGGTSVGESLMLCARHHWLAHEGGWTLAVAADGQVIVAKPPPRVWTYARGPDSPRAA
jgi:hypothetical protein